jgi:hypothetical protein
MKRSLVLILSLVIMASFFGCTNDLMVEEYEPVATAEVSEQTEILNDMIVALEDDTSPVIANPQETAVPIDEEVLEHVDHGIGITYDTHINKISRYVISVERYKELTSYVISEPREVKDQETYIGMIYDILDKDGKVVYQLQYNMTLNNEYCSNIYIKQKNNPTQKEREHFKLLTDCVVHSYAAVAVDFLGWEGCVGLNANAMIKNGMSLDQRIELVRTYENGRVVAHIKSAKIDDE